MKKEKEAVLPDLEITVRKKVNQSMGDRLFMAGVYLFLTVAMVLVLYPLILVVSSSFSSAHAVISGRVWLFPVEPTLEGYARVFQNASVLTGFRNSFFLLIVGTAINVFMTILAAYPLSRKTFGGGKIIMRLFVICMIFTSGIVPMYMVVRDLNLTDNLWGLILPGSLTVYYVIIARTFFMTTIPEELYESAYLDGCREFRILFSIVMPLSKAVLAVLALMYGIQHWNSYFNSLIYLKSTELYPLQLVLRNILVQNSVDISSVADVRTMLEMEGMRDLLKYSLIVVSSLPVLVIYPFVQKYFVKGMMLGAVKG